MSKLKKFNKSNKKKNTIKLVIAFLLVAVMSAAMSYAVYQKEDEVLFINAKVGSFETSNSDIELAMIVDGEEVSMPPEKNDLYIVTIECDYADGVWDKEKWGATITNITSNRVKCNINFSIPEPTLSEVTATSEKTSITLSYTANGLNINTTCKYGISEGNYENSVEEVQNIGCNIEGLEMDTTYYYKVCTKNSINEICKTGSIKTLPDADPISKVKVGDYISMTPTSTSYTILKNLTGYSSDQTINPSELNLWRVIKKNGDGTVEVVSEYVSSKELAFTGTNGFLNYVGNLNKLASQYTNERYVLKTRHMGYKSQIEFCENLSSCPSDTDYVTDINLIKTALGKINLYDENGTLHYSAIASRGVNNGLGQSTRDVRKEDGTLGMPALRPSGQNYDGTQYSSLRPILTLKSSVGIVSGDGKTKSTAYQLD